ncbi:hypothetical protein [Cecembia sp.]|uniref:hypothetical protein n=1 Tax=Cecembia sp. TaxID=1898110 RepID=UPI0025C092EA|nr:hypothetical protein [Cecembia sp.]
MMLTRPYILVLLVILFACNPDIDKDITTDLQVEGNEIFRVSFALEESYLFAFQNLDAYRNADTLSLPGCPDILINETDRKVTLDFDVERDCPRGNTIERKGKIHLEFLQPGTFERITLISYEDYEVKNFRIEGSREFRQLLNFNRRTESFSDLLILDQFGSSTRVNGEYEFTLSFTNSTLSEFEVTGSLNGRNITGRPIRMEPNNPKKYQASCILSGQHLPNTGRETWRIFRNTTLATTHNLNYEADSDCQNKAIVNLSDGRQVIFEQ